MIAEEILELVRSRSSPGMLILGLDNKLLYSNQEATSLLKDTENIHPELQFLCDEVKAHANGRAVDADTQSSRDGNPQVKDLRGGGK